jgi:hypothetical protein
MAKASGNFGGFICATAINDNDLRLRGALAQMEEKFTNKPSFIPNRNDD